MEGHGLDLSRLEEGHEAGSFNAVRSLRVP